MSTVEDGEGGSAARLNPLKRRLNYCTPVAPLGSLEPHLAARMAMVPLPVAPLLPSRRLPWPSCAFPHLRWWRP